MLQPLLPSALFGERGQYYDSPNDPSMWCGAIRSSETVSERPPTHTSYVCRSSSMVVVTANVVSAYLFMYGALPTNDIIVSCLQTAGNRNTAPIIQYSSCRTQRGLEPSPSFSRLYLSLPLLLLRKRLRNVRTPHYALTAWIIAIGVARM